MIKEAKIIIFLTIFFLIPSLAYSGGIGISPASIEIQNILRGGYAEIPLTVSNPNEVNISVSIGIFGDIKEWSIPLTREIIVPPKGFKTFKILVTPPKDIPVGIYKGEIMVSAKPIVTEVSGSTGAIISTAAISTLTLEINDIEIRKSDLVSVRIKENEECKPLYIYPKIKNLGNVRIYPKYIVYLYTEDGTELLAQKEESFPELLPTQEREDTIRIDTRLSQVKCISEGTYKIILEFYDEDTFVTKKEIKVKIHPPGTFTVLGEIINITTSEKISLGSIAKISVLFKNIGEAVITAKLKGEAYHENELVDLIESEQVTLNPEEEAELTAYFKPKETGNYTIYAWVSYESKTTEKHKFVIEVAERNLMPYIILAVIIILGAIIALKMKKRKRRWL